MKTDKVYNIEYKCESNFLFNIKNIIIFIVNFARFGEANEYISKRNDYKFGIKIIRENKLDPNNNLSISSTNISLNDSLMYFKEEALKL